MKFAPQSIHPFVVVATLICVLVAVRIMPFTATNFKSLTFLNALLNDELLVDGYEVETNPRFLVWHAQSALLNDRPEQAIIILDASSITDSPSADNVKAEALATLGDFEQAIYYWKRAGAASQLQELALASKQAGDVELTILAHEAAWSLNVDDMTLDYADFLKNEIGDLDNAIRVLEGALSSIPDSQHSQIWYRRLGSFQADSKRWEEALSTYSVGVELFPQDWQLWLGLGWAQLQSSSSFETVRQSFYQAHLLAPEAVQPINALAELYIRDEQFREADNWLLLSLSLDANPTAMHKRVRLALQEGQRELAAEILQNGVGQFPQYAPMFFELANLHTAAGDFQLGLESIQQARQLDQTNIDFMLLEAELLEKTDDVVNAIFVYEQIIQLDSNNPLAASALARLNSLP